MAFELRYGNGETVRVDLPAEAVADYSRPRGEPVADPQQAVIAALAEPVGFPALSQATVSGDRIAIALDRGVPQVAAVVAGVVQSLLVGHATPSDIHVIVADELERLRDPLSLIPAAIRDEIQLHVHDGNKKGALAYLAAARDGKPIYFNRQIGDADVIVPISALRLDATLGYVGVHGGLFPTFSDAATQERFRRSSANWNSNRHTRREEADEAAWLLGVQFTVQVAPGPGDSILHVLAGESRAVADRGRRLCEAAWLHQPSRRASLVVAGIEGGPAEQTWENFSRALFVASRAVSEGGAIVLCTRLQGTERPAMLSEFHDDESIAVEIDDTDADDRLAMSLLRQARERAKVFLLSDLDGDTVEDLGLGHVAHADEVMRLSRQYNSCILLGNAQYAQVAALDEFTTRGE